MGLSVEPEPTWVVEVYREPLHRRFHTSRCSCSYLFFIGMSALAVILPFFMAYSGQNFWLKENTYREQPLVQYEHKVVMLLEGTQSTGDAIEAAPFQAFYSTVPSGNDLYQSSVRVPTIQSHELDENRDGTTDRLELNLQVPLLAGERVHSAKLLVFFNYRFRERSKLDMEVLAYVHGEGAVPGQSLWVDGDLRFRQTWPLQVRGGYQRPYTDDPLLEPDTKARRSAQQPVIIGSEDFVFENVLQQYAARNYSADFAQRYPVWQPASAVRSDDFGGLAEPFNVTAVVRVPIEKVSYTPGLAEIIKVAWIQYVSMFLVVSWVMDRFCAFVYHNQVLETNVRVESGSSYVGPKLHSF